MNKNNSILNEIPYERIQNKHVKAGECFNLFKLGEFKVEASYFQEVTRGDEGQLMDEMVELVELQSNSEYQPHYHEKSSAVIYIVLGEGVLMLDQREMAYSPGHRVVIPAKCVHGFKTSSKTLFLSIQSPPIRNVETGEVDIHYLEGESN